jgi:hypothetical protein
MPEIHLPPGGHLRKLREEGLEGHAARALVFKAVGVDKGAFHIGDKCERHIEPLPEKMKRTRRRLGPGPYFTEDPWIAFFYQKEIDFMVILIPDIAEVIVTEPPIGEKVDCLKEMQRGEIFISCPFIVTQIRARLPKVSKNPLSHVFQRLNLWISSKIIMRFFSVIRSTPASAATPETPLRIVFRWSKLSQLKYVA